MCQSGSCTRIPSMPGSSSNRLILSSRNCPLIDASYRSTVTVESDQTAVPILPATVVSEAPSFPPGWRPVRRRPPAVGDQLAHLDCNLPGCWRSTTFPSATPPDHAWSRPGGGGKVRGVSIGLWERFMDDSVYRGIRYVAHQPGRLVLVGEDFHHLAHFVELFDEAVDILNRGAAPFAIRLRRLHSG